MPAAAVPLARVNQEVPGEAPVEHEGAGLVVFVSPAQKDNPDVSLETSGQPIPEVSYLPSRVMTCGSVRE